MKSLRRIAFSRAKPDSESFKLSRRHAMRDLRLNRRSDRIGRCGPGETRICRNPSILNDCDQFGVLREYEFSLLARDKSALLQDVCTGPERDDIFFAHGLFYEQRIQAYRKLLPTFRMLTFLVALRSTSVKWLTFSMGWRGDLRVFQLFCPGFL